VIATDKLDESIYTISEPKDDFGTFEFDKYLKIKNKTIISTGCTTGNKSLANIIVSSGNIYIAPDDYISASSIILFTSLFFYNLTKGNNVLKAYDLCKSLYIKDFCKIKEYTKI